MNHSLKFIFLVAALMMLTACPYESPIDLNTYEESLKIDKRLLGEWVMHGDGGSYENIKLGKAEKSKTVYDVWTDSYDADGTISDHEYQRAYATMINQNMIFNMEKKDGKYSFFKYKRMSDDVIILHFIADEFVKEHYADYEKPNRASLREFLQLNTDKTELYDAPIHLYRKGSEAQKKAKGL